MLRRRIWLSLASIAALTAGMAGGAAWGWKSLNQPLELPVDGAWLDVPSGAPLRRVATGLAERQLLRHPWLLIAYGRATGDATRIRAGEYQLQPGATPLSLLRQLIDGQVFLHQITIIEGSRFSDAVAAVRSHPAIVAGTLDADGIMAALGQPGVHPEGQLYPDTYRFPKGTPDVELLRMAHQSMQTRLDEAWRNRQPDIVLKTPYEALILGSIIEKETALASERPLIAGVFHERLRRNMRLQTDPTVIYGLGQTFDGNLRRQDLERDTPYNTYTRGGLPPTPIALPGGEALLAAVTPEISTAVYFVATGRGDGSHHFSATLEEHERAVRAYLEQLRSREQ